MFRILAKKGLKLHQNGNILQILGLFCSFLTIICPFCAKFRHFWPQNHDFWAKNSKISYISLNILKKFHISKILFWKLFWGKIHRKSYREEFFWEISLKNPIVKKILEEYPQKIPSWRKFLANIHWTSNRFKNWTLSRPSLHMVLTWSQKLNIDMFLRPCRLNPHYFRALARLKLKLG